MCTLPPLSKRLEMVENEFIRIHEYIIKNKLFRYSRFEKTKSLLNRCAPQNMSVIMIEQPTYRFLMFYMDFLGEWLSNRASRFGDSDVKYYCYGELLLYRDVLKMINVQAFVPNEEILKVVESFEPPKEANDELCEYKKEMLFYLGKQIGCINRAFFEAEINPKGRVRILSSFSYYKEMSFRLAHFIIDNSNQGIIAKFEDFYDRELSDYKNALNINFQTNATWNFFAIKSVIEDMKAARCRKAKEAL